MNCVNTTCGKPVISTDCDFTFKVLLCKQCSTNLKRARSRIRSELEVLLATLDDTLRFGVTSDLHFADRVDESTTREDVLEFITKLDKLCRNTSRMTNSSKSMKPNAITADGPKSSIKQ